MTQPHPHFTTGEPCYCGWGRNDLKSKIASSFEELQGMKRYKGSDAQGVLNYLQQHRFINERTEKWIPWLMNEIKKGDISVGWEVECPACEGEGTHPCEECEGRGRVDCPECESSPSGGYDEDGNVCEHCGGNGDLDCGYCSQGDDDCFRCVGEGSVAGYNINDLRDKGTLQIGGATDAHGLVNDPTNKDNSEYVNEIHNRVKELYVGSNPFVQFPNNDVGDGSGTLGSRVWEHWCDWLNGGSASRQQFNPTNDGVKDLEQGVTAWDQKMKEDAERANRDEVRAAGTVIHTDPDGWNIRSLSPEELKAEGDSMGHCVGNYADEVRNGDLQVLSLRDPEGDPHVTTGIEYDQIRNEELGQPHGQQKGTIGQHYGKGNQQPKPEYNERLRNYFQTLPEEVRPYSGEFHKPIDHIEDLKKHLGLVNGEREVDNLGLQHEPAIRYDHIMDSLVNKGLDAYGHIWPEDTEALGAPDNFYDPENGKIFYDFCQQPANAYSDEWIDDPADDLKHSILRWQDWSNGNTPDNARVQMTNHLTDMYNNDPRNAMDSIPTYNPETKSYEEFRVSSISDWDYGTHPHFYDGKPCSCPWGEVDNHKTAAKIDMLMKRKDLQTPEAQEVLNSLANQAWPDKILPWVIREWKKGRLLPATNLLSGPLTYFTFPETGEPQPPFTKADAYKILNISDRLGTYKNHPQNEFGGGINLDQHTATEIVPYVEKAEQWLENVDRSKGGDTVHQFEGSHVNPRLMPKVECPECEGYGNGSVTDECQECDGKGTIQSRRPEDVNTVNTEGWTVKRLATPQDCVREGKDMHHCVGQDQYAQGVSKDPDESSHHLFSLRDHENYPHATIQLGKPLGSEGQYVNQIQGEWDKPGHPDHLDMVNDWLKASHPGQGLQGYWAEDEDQDQCADCGEYGEDCDCHFFAGPVNAQGVATGGGGHISQGEWWDDQYPTEQAESVEDYLNQPRFSPYEVEHSSDPNWDRAMGDYNTHHEDAHRQYGVYLEPPSLYYPEPDFDSIWDDLADPVEQVPPWRQDRKTPLFKGYGEDENLAGGYRRHREFDPELHQSVANSAADQYHMREIKEKYDDWLEGDYEGDKYPYERQMKDFWDKEFAKHVNPSTGEWEDPIPWSSVRRTERPSHLPNYRDLKGHSRDAINSEGEAIGGETAVDRWWKDNSHNYPQIPYQPNAEGVGYEGQQYSPGTGRQPGDPLTEFNKGDDQMPDWNPWREDTDKPPNGFTDTTVPPKPSYWSKIAHRTHPHIFYGHPCTCPWGHDMEFHGSVKTAARIDKLRGEKGPAYLKTPEGEQLLKVLENYSYPDVLIPWICREWSKGNITQEGGSYPCFGDLHYQMISPARAVEIADTINEMKKIPANKGGGGIDLMQYDAKGLHDKINQSMKFLEERDRPNRGEIVHRFDEPNEGWTVRKIRNKNEAEIEGRMDQMNNCVRGYGADIESGHAHMFSLRDPDNHPHVSLQLNNADLNADNSVREMNGQSNSPVEPEHLGMVNEFLGKHGIDEAQSQEPWWDEAYYRHPAEDAVSYAHMTEEGYDDYGHEAPDEWFDAYNAAEEMGLEPPELYDSPPDIPAVWDDMTKSKNWLGGADKDWEKEKEVHNQVIENAKNRGELEEFYNQHKDWSQDSSNLETPYSRQMNDHWQQEMKQHLDPYDGEFEAPTWVNGSSPQRPGKWDTARDKWWNHNQDDYPQIPGYDWQPVDPDGVQRQQPPIPSFIASAPLYYRWVFSPESGEVELSHNQEGHPAEIPYHEQLADKINRANVVNGYAYRIGNGWRLSDDEHKPVEDPYVVSQVMRALGMTNERRSAEWTADEDYDRLHYGLPVIKD